MWTALHAIAEAEAILPGRPTSEPGDDPRWHAIIRVAEFAKADPEPLWTFALRWGASPDADLRQAVASCLLEHLLEHHFVLIFPRVELATRTNHLFAETFMGCWAFGETESPENLLRFERLKRELRLPAR